MHCAHAKLICYMIITFCYIIVQVAIMALGILFINVYLVSHAYILHLSRIRIDLSIEIKKQNKNLTNIGHIY